MKMRLVSGLMVAFLLVFTSSVCAVPRIQTYIRDATYMTVMGMEEDSWVISEASFELKVVGFWHPALITYPEMFAPPAMPYDYMDCYIMISVPEDEVGSVWINGLEITSFNNQIPVGINAEPSLYNHSPVGYADFAFNEIGTVDNTQINAFNYGFDSMGEVGFGNEISMDVRVEGFTWTHFDAVGIDAMGNTYVNPYSHESTYIVPEPGTLSLLGLGLLGLIPILRRKRG